MTFLNSILNNSKEHKDPFKHWEYNDALTDGAIEEIIKADIPDVRVPADACAFCAAFKSFTSVQDVPLYCSVFATTGGEEPPNIKPAVDEPIPAPYRLAVCTLPPEDQEPAYTTGSSAKNCIAEPFKFFNVVILTYRNCCVCFWCIPFFCCYTWRSL